MCNSFPFSALLPPDDFFSIDVQVPTPPAGFYLDLHEIAPQTIGSLPATLDWFGPREGTGRSWKKNVEEKAVEKREKSAGDREWSSREVLGEYKRVRRAGLSGGRNAN